MASLTRQRDALQIENAEINAEYASANNRIESLENRNNSLLKKIPPEDLILRELLDTASKKAELAELLKELANDYSKLAEEVEGKPTWHKLLEDERNE